VELQKPLGAFFVLCCFCGAFFLFFLGTRTFVERLSRCTLHCQLEAAYIRSSNSLSALLKIYVSLGAVQWALSALPCCSMPETRACAPSSISGMSLWRLSMTLVRQFCLFSTVYWSELALCNTTAPSITKMEMCRCSNKLKYSKQLDTRNFASGNLHALNSFRQAIPLKNSRWNK
jgi:hypothetical protein